MEGPPMMTRGAAPQIAIRDVKSIDELSQLKAVEKEVWGMVDEDTLPLTLAIACKAVGNIFVGAFDKDKLVGFAFGFLGREHGQTTIHSHMLAVLDSYRHLDLGSRLKQAQRERAMAIGVREMTRPYDPLQRRNPPPPFSHPPVSSAAHTLCARRRRAALVRFDPSGKPGRADLAESLARQRVNIEIPGDILEVERTDMGLAREWRDATRWAFREAVKAGFIVAEFCRSIRGQQGPGAYLLQRGTVSEFIPEP